MTILSLAMLIAAAVGFALTCILLVPAMTQMVYSNRMYAVAAELDDALTTGKVPNVPYAHRLMDALYFYAENPRHASLVILFEDARKMPELEVELRELKRVASPEQEKLIHHFANRGASLTARQMILNSIGWFPLYGLISMTRLKKVLWDALFGKRKRFAVSEWDLVRTSKEPAVASEKELAMAGIY